MSEQVLAHETIYNKRTAFIEENGKPPTVVALSVAMLKRVVEESAMLGHQTVIEGDRIAYDRIFGMAFRVIDSEDPDFCFVTVEKQDLWEQSGPTTTGNILQYKIHNQYPTRNATESTTAANIKFDMWLDDWRKPTK